MIKKYWAKEYAERTANEKNLISCMKQLMIAILSFVSCISVWLEFNNMVCFTLMIPVTLSSLEDALCATTFRKKMLDSVITFFAAIALVLIISSLKFDTLATNGVIIKAIEWSSVLAPLKSLEVFLYKAIKTRVEGE